MASWPAVSTTPAITKATRPVISATLGLIRPRTAGLGGLLAVHADVGLVAVGAPGGGLGRVQPPGRPLVELGVAAHVAGGGLADLGLRAAPAPDTVTFSAILAVGRSSASLNSVTRTGVMAAAKGVPEVQKRETTIAATADATLAMASVRRSRLLASPRSLRVCEDMREAG